MSFCRRNKKVGYRKTAAKNPIRRRTCILPAFYVIQETAKWIFLEGNETELKHTFLSSEL